ncbi:MFS transporter [Streptosporangium lutulentum]
MTGNDETTTPRTAGTDKGTPGPALPRGVTLLFAIACGTAVANVYFAQPLLVTLGRDFAISPATLGAVVTLTQLGYGLGLFFIVPLGDLLNRRRLIVTQLLLLAAALTVVGTATVAALLLAGMAAVGLLAVVTQTLVAFAASLAPPAQRGRVVGLVTSGVVTGILLARTVSGLLADLAAGAPSTSPRRPSPACSPWHCTTPCRPATPLRCPCATDGSCAPRSPCSRRSASSGSAPCSPCSSSPPSAPCGAASRCR